MYQGQTFKFTGKILQSKICYMLAIQNIKESNHFMEQNAGTDVIFVTSTFFFTVDVYLASKSILKGSLIIT